MCVCVGRRHAESEGAMNLLRDPLYYIAVIVTVLFIQAMDFALSRLT
jgi:hypothetical protein